MSTNERCTFVIPTYNGSQRLRSLVANLVAYASTISHPVEILIVDDGSTPEEWSKVEAFVMNTAACHAVKLRRNIGQHRATLVGMLLAQQGSIVTLDDDAPPELVHKILANEAVLRSPSTTGSLHFIQTRHGRELSSSAVLGSMAKMLISFLCSFPSYRRASSTRLIGRTLANHILHTCTDSAGNLVVPARRISLDALVLAQAPQVSFSAEPIVIPRMESRYTLRSLGEHAATVLVSFWHYQGIRAFYAPLLLGSLFVPWTVIPVTLSVMLTVLGVATSRWGFNRGEKFFRVTDLLEQCTYGQRDRAADHT